MAAAGKSRRALGRGLGSLIPSSGDSDVSRETIDPPAHERAVDVFFADRGTRAGRDAARDDVSGGRGVETEKSGGHDSDAMSAPGSESEPLPTGGASGHRGSRYNTRDLLNPRRPQRGAKRGARVHSGRAAAHGESPASRGTGKSGTGENSIGKAAGGKSQTRRTPNMGKDAAFVDPVPTGAAPANAHDVSDRPELVAVPGATFAEIPLESVIPNLRQPREIFDADELAELADSIAEIGVLQPIVVRPIDSAQEEYQTLIEQRHPDRNLDEVRFELIMGERRLRASTIAGLVTIPAIIRSTDDTDMLRDALLENLHRSQLNAIEEAAAYQQLMDDFECTQEELSKKIARSRSQIANTVRLLKLPAPVQRRLAAGVISAGHARALLALDDADQMQALADRIIAEGLSVRSTEEIVTLAKGKNSRSRSRKAAGSGASGAAVVTSAQRSVAERLEDLFDTRVTVVPGKKRGKIVVEYAGDEDFDRIAGIIASLKI